MARTGGTAREALAAELADYLAKLGNGDELTIVELASGGVVVWKIDRKPNGTPRCRFRPAEPWGSLGIDLDLSASMLREIALPGDGSVTVLVRTSADGPTAKAAFRELADDPEISAAFVCPGPLGDVLEDVRSDDGLTQFYELVLLGQNGSARPELVLQPLFPPGAKRGDVCQLKVRCEPTDERGVAFAVVASKGGQFRLVSIKSVNVVPGSYLVTAELRRPGLVRFDGLDGAFHDDHRNWADLVASLPGRLDLCPPAHLICLVEINGTVDEVGERLRRAAQLIEMLPGAVVSLISYGPHRVGRDLREGPVDKLAWATTPAQALERIQQLEAGNAALTSRQWYAHGAQLECVLIKVTEELAKAPPSGGANRRLVVVTAGARPAFPARRDPTMRIPCPDRHDWRAGLERLRRHPAGTTFGAILDRQLDDDIWTELGRDALVFGDTVDVRSFAHSLGLIAPDAEPVPFPLLEPQGE